MSKARLFEQPLLISTRIWLEILCKKWPKYPPPYRRMTLKLPTALTVAVVVPIVFAATSEHVSDALEIIGATPSDIDDIPENVSYTPGDAIDTLDTVADTS